jgi:hypothetical protein
MMTLFNIVGYEAIRKLTKLMRPDVNKPLGAGLPSEISIVGGDVVYGDHHSDHPLFQRNPLKNLVGAVTGKSVRRAGDGRLLAIVSVRSPFQQLAELNKVAGLEDFQFFCSDEYISNNIERPTIFQNVVEGSVDAGATVTLIPGTPPLRLPVGFRFNVFTTATGYVERNTFNGVLYFDYNYQLIRGPLSGNSRLDSVLATVPAVARLEGEGTFKIILNLPSV